MAMLSPEIVTAPEGLFDNWLQKRGKLGGQHKVPRCMNGRSIMEQLLSLHPNFSNIDNA
jgi:hypothetical protein